MVGKNIAFLSLIETILDNLVFPLIEEPDCLCLGVTSIKAASCLMLLN